MEVTQLTEDEIYLRLKILRDSVDGRSRRQARHELLGSDQKTLNTVLDQLVRHETDTEILAYTAELIVESQGEHKAERILSLLQANDWALRQHICGLLANCGDKNMSRVLLERLRFDSSADVRSTAAYALGQIGDEQAIPDLEWVIAHDFASDFQGATVSAAASAALAAIRNVVHPS